MPLLNLILATTPILILALTLLLLKWSLIRSASLAWLTSLIISFLFFETGFSLLGFSSLKGLLLGLWINYLVFGGLLLYNVIKDVGAVKSITDGISRVTTDPVLQTLIVAWALSGLIQGVSGFGLPIVILAPILIGLGLKPIKTVACIAIGHSWAVAFGSMSSSFFTLALITGLSMPTLAYWTSIFLGIASILTGFLVAFVHGGIKSIKKGFIAIMVMGPSMAFTYFIVSSVALSYMTASVISGLVGIFCGIALTKTRFYMNKKVKQINTDKNKINFNLGFLPYYVVIILSIIVGWPTNISKWLSTHLSIGFNFPETVTGLGWVNLNVVSYPPFNMLTHPGTILLVSTFVGLLFFKLKGYQTFVSQGIKNSFKSGYKSMLGILFTTMTALIVNESGMAFFTAQETMKIAGNNYFFLIPFIGALGTFLTGTTTSSNALFGVFQKSTADIAGANAYVASAGQASGASVAGMISPPKLAIGLSTSGAEGKLSDVIRKTIGPLFLLLVVLSILTAIFAFT